MLWTATTRCWEDFPKSSRDFGAGDRALTGTGTALRGRLRLSSWNSTGFAGVWGSAPNHVSAAGGGLEPDGDEVLLVPGTGNERPGRRRTPATPRVPSRRRVDSFHVLHDVSGVAGRLWVERGCLLCRFRAGLDSSREGTGARPSSVDWRRCSLTSEGLEAVWARARSAPSGRRRAHDGKFQGIFPTMSYTSMSGAA